MSDENNEKNEEPVIGEGYIRLSYKWILIFVPLIFMLGGIAGRFTDYGKEIELLKVKIESVKAITKEELTVSRREFNEDLKNLRAMNEGNHKVISQRVSKNINRQEQKNKSQDSQIQQLFLKH